MSTSNIIDLIDLDKKVIYIDQFAISDMMKALNPNTRAHKKGRLDTFWITLFKKLDRLCKLQLIVCPESEFHTDESLLAPFFKPLERMYKLLSVGIRFYDYQTIKRLQILEYAKNWISGKEERDVVIDVNHVVDGEINDWQKAFAVSVKLPYNLDWINDLRKYRERTHQGIRSVFKRWQSEQNKTFDDWFEEEVIGIGQAILKIYEMHQKRLSATATGYLDLTVNDTIAPPEVVLVYSIQDVFIKAGIQKSDIWQKTEEFLASPLLKKIPYIKIFGNGPFQLH